MPEENEDKWLTGTWMQTFTGVRFRPTDPNPDDVRIADIAHSLSMQCRYNGHVKEFYSVAEHCVLMSRAVPAEFALEALLHDATEAYVGDMVRPLKIQMPEFQEAERKVATAIGEKFGVRPSSDMSPEVKDADNRILLDEKVALFPDIDRRAFLKEAGIEPLRVYIQGWEPSQAEREYMMRFLSLVNSEEREAWL